LPPLSERIGLQNKNATDSTGSILMMRHGAFQPQRI
jgi:hypothetical protein